MLAMPSRRQLCALFLGIIIGFFLGILILDPGGQPRPKKHPYVGRQSTCGHARDKSSQTYHSFESWLRNQGAIRNQLDIDEYLYGALEKRPTLEAEFLRKKVYVTCIVFAEKEKNLIAASNTWLKHCNDYQLYYAKRPHDLRGKEFLPDLSVKIIEAKSSWDFLCKTVLDLWNTRQSKLEWILFVADDMFVIPENLRKMVAHFDAKDPYYLGHAQTLWAQPFNVALAGYVLSRGTVEIMAGNYTSDTCSSGGKYWKKEDYYLGKNLEEMCVLPSDTRDDSGKGRFHGYNLNQLLFSNKLALIASYWKDSMYPSAEGKQCCSDLSVTFQGIEADKMFTYDYIINHLRVFTQGHYGSQPAPTPYPPEQVWQNFMKSRGYSDLENVSSKQYFDAWKAKINEDLIKAGFKKKKHIWRGMDFKSGDGHGEAIPLPFQFDSVLDTD